MRNDRQGFTLIELLIVVVIIGILAAIAIPKFSATREKAYFSAMKSDLKNLQTQQELYYSNDHDADGQPDYTYAADAADADLEFTGSPGVTVTVSEGTQTGWAATTTHAALGNDAAKSCGIYVGNATAPATFVTSPNVVMCTGE